MEIMEKRENSLLSRTEVAGVISFDGATPSRQDLVKAISEKLKVPKDMVVIRKVTTAFGSRKASFDANVYKDAAALAFEQKHLIARGKPKKAGEGSEEKEAKEAAAPAPEKPKEKESKEK